MCQLVLLTLPLPLTLPLTLTLTLTLPLPLTLPLTLSLTQGDSHVPAGARALCRARRDDARHGTVDIA